MNQTVFQDNPYAAPAAPVADEAAPDIQLADRGLRLAAVLLDGLFFGCRWCP
jgi:hypothetical protein